MEPIIYLIAVLIVWSPLFYSAYKILCWVNDKEDEKEVKQRDEVEDNIRNRNRRKELSWLSRVKRDSRDLAHSEVVRYYLDNRSIFDDFGWIREFDIRQRWRNRSMEREMRRYHRLVNKVRNWYFKRDTRSQYNEMENFDLDYFIIKQGIPQERRDDIQLRWDQRKLKRQLKEATVQAYQSKTVANKRRM